MSARVCVVVVNFASADLIGANLAGLTGSGPGARPEVVVVDNLSTVAERTSVRSLGDQRGWRIIEPEANLGFGAGANLGVEAALAGGADVVCLLNPDAVIDPGGLALMAGRAEADRSSLRAPRVVTATGQDWFTGGRIDLVAGRTPKAEMAATGGADRNWLSGACLVFHADAWRLTDGFDPDFFLYWEDVDLSWRHVEAGGQLAYDGDVTVQHSVGGSQRDDQRLGRGRSPLYYFYNCRNRLLFATKHLDAATQRRWALSAPRYAREVLLRGGRRQFLRPWTPLSAVVRGTWSGLTSGLTSRLTSRRSGRTAARARVRVYRALRTAHLERFAELEPATVFYCGQRYDFDPALAAGLDLHRVPGALALFTHLVGRDVETLEINEPLMLSATRTNLAAVAGVRLGGALRGRRTQVVSYAIENLDPFTGGQQRVRRRWRRGLHRAATRFVLGQVDRLAFGTEAARQTYQPWLAVQHAGQGPEVRVIPALSAPWPEDPAATTPRSERSGVVFLGAFDERKGLRQVLAAWPGVRGLVPGTTLTLLGKGELEPLARAAAAEGKDVRLIVDPSRSVIHDTLGSAAVLVLLSHGSTTWREQVGLPIVEGLAHGCEIVTTDQTGLASWLHEHGHRVLAADSSLGATVEALADAVAHARPSQDVSADLPRVDGRLAADRWLFAAAIAGH